MFKNKNFDLDSEKVILKTSPVIGADEEIALDIVDINDIFEAISLPDGSIRTVTTL